MDIVFDTASMTESLGATELERFPDRWRAERLPGVDRDVEVLAANTVEGVEVAGRPVALFGTGDVEADHAGVAPADRTLGDFDRASRLAHGRHQQPHLDRPAGLLGVG